MIPSWVKVGAKCISLYDFHDAQKAGFDAPHRGAIYTVREIDEGPGFYDCIRVVEITNPLCDDGWEPSWVIHRFRPLVSKTEPEDLAVFRRIADLAGVDEALRRLEGVE